MRATTAGRGGGWDGLPLCDALFCLACLLAWAAQLLTAAVFVVATHTDLLTLAVFASIWVLSSAAANAASYWTEREAALAHVLQVGVVRRGWKLLSRRSDWSRDDARKAILRLCLFQLIGIGPPGLCGALLSLLRALGNQEPIHFCLTPLFLAQAAWSLAPLSGDLLRGDATCFILSWPGALAQFLWRLGTLSSRLALLVSFGLRFPLPSAAFLAAHLLLVLCVAGLFFQRHDGSVTLLILSCLPFALDFYGNPLLETRLGLQSRLFYGLVGLELVLVCAQLWSTEGLVGGALGFHIALGGLLLFGLLSLLLYHACLHPKLFLQSSEQGGFKQCSGYRRKRKRPSQFRPSVIDVDSDQEGGFSRRPTVSPREAFNVSGNSHNSCQIVESEL